MNLDDPRISNSARQVQPFLAMEIFERSQELERQGIDIVHLEVGEPDFSVPACVDRAISKAVEGGHTHYTHSLGRYDLREEVAAYYKRRYGVTVDAGRVLVTGGTLRRTDGGLIGTLATDSIRQFKFDLAVIGCSALDAEGDILDFDIQEVGVSRAILRHSRKTYLVADHSKFKRSAPARIASLAEVDLFVTDEPLSFHSPAPF